MREAKPSSQVKSRFGVTGMTCGSCEATIEEELSKLPGVDSVKADRAKSQVEIVSERLLSLPEIRRSLSGLPKYSVTDDSGTKAVSPAPLRDPRPTHEIYRPLWVLFLFVAVVSFAVQADAPEFRVDVWMRHFMAGFFVGVSYFKFLDLRAFAEGFSGYDPLARIWPRYGLIYPFLELGIGVLLAAGMATSVANLAAALILSITTFGVANRLRKPSSFECACLGSAFKLPLSNVTIVENLLMIAMAIMGLIH